MKKKQKKQQSFDFDFSSSTSFSSFAFHSKHVTKMSQKFILFRVQKMSVRNCIRTTVNLLQNEEIKNDQRKLAKEISKSSLNVQRNVLF